MVIGIQDEILKINSQHLLDRLLMDKTTKSNIIWATDAYTELGTAYHRDKEITVDLITGQHSGVIKNRARKAFDKLAKKASAEEPTKELTQQEADPKVKLDDALRQAVTEYNDAYTTMNDNGNALCVLRTRAVDLIDNIEALINSIANRPKSFDTDIAVIQNRAIYFTK